MNEYLSRNMFFDNAKFLFVIFVVVVHFLPVGSLSPKLPYDNHILQTFEYLLFTFTMQAFVFISGALSKNNYSQECITKMVMQLMVPYFVLCTIAALIAPGYSTCYLLDPPPISWYLPALFVWRLTMPIFLSFRYPILMSVIASIIIGYEDRIGSFMTLSRIVTFFPYFIAGFLYCDTLLTIKNKIQYPALFGFSVLFLAYVIIYYLPINADWFLMVYSYHTLDVTWLNGTLIRTTQIIFGFVLLFMAFLIIPNKACLFSKLGTRSMYPYLLHPLIILLCLKMGVFEPLSTFKQYMLVPLGILTTVLLSTSYIQKLFEPLLYPSFCRYLLNLKSEDKNGSDTKIKKQKLGYQHSS